MRGATVPLGQIFVRDREAQGDQARDTEQGRRSPAAGPDGGSAPAAISADGSTVVWAGTNAALQTVLLPGRGGRASATTCGAASRTGPPPRRAGSPGLPIQTTPAARRGIAFRSDDQTTTAPATGRWRLPEDNPAAGGISNKLPAMSADGRQVAFLTGPSPRPDLTSGASQLDLYVTDMSAGRDPQGGHDRADARDRRGHGRGGRDRSISADGRRVAFVTARTVFPLRTPRLIDPPPVHDGPVGELYVVDLGAMEIERVTRAFDGGSIDDAIEGEVGTLSMSADGGRIAFISRAANLFFGDSNSATDAFVLTEVDPNADAGRAAGEPPFAEIGPPTEGRARSTQSLRLKVRRKGSSLRVTVRVPGGGRVAGRARGRVPPGKKVTTLASGRTRATKAGSKTFTVRPAMRYRGALRRQGVIRTRLVVTFTPTGGERQSQRAGPSRCAADEARPVTLRNFTGETLVKPLCPCRGQMEKVRISGRFQPVNALCECC